MAESFKFGKMSKKKAFFPTLNIKQYFEQASAIDSGVTYIPGSKKNENS